MQIGYSGPGGNSPRYLCGQAKQLYGPEHGCQSIGGGRLEETVLQQLFAVLAPAALSATAAVLAQADATYQKRLRVFETNVERARFEADRARRQYDLVEPENRLVARTLEAALEANLAAARAAENDLAVQRVRRPVSLTAQETRLADQGRRGRARGVRGTHHNHDRTQATDPGCDQRDRAGRRRPGKTGASADHLAGRRGHRGHDGDDQARLPPQDDRRGHPDPL
jgi:hypothetical protein